jgi:predicted GNAT family acetyltransferase
VTSPRLVGRAGSLEIVDNESGCRYEARQDGDLAGVIEYVAHDGWLVLEHTIVGPEFEGRGIASNLVRMALDDIRARAMRLAPTCPYVLSFIKRHPEYRDLVVGVRGPRHDGS